MSKCTYCGSSNFGKGCLYGPHKIHIHINKNKCIYCGSSNFGPGCLYNPNKMNGKRYHVHGIEFNHMVKEQSLKATKSLILLENLNIESKDIDYFKRLKQLLKGKDSLLNEELYLNSVVKNVKIKDNKRVLSVEQKMEEVVSSIFDLMEEGIHSGLSKIQLTNLLFEKYFEHLQSRDQY